VTIIALIDLQVKIVAEGAHHRALTVFEGQVGRFVVGMASVAVTVGVKGGFTIMASSAGLTGIHVGHGHPLAVAERKQPGMAIAALVVDLQVEIMAEGAHHHALTVLEGQVGRLVTGISRYRNRHQHNDNRC